MKSSKEFLRETLEDWAMIYGKKLTPREIETWLKIFSKTHPTILAKALDYVTKNNDRMPTPGHLTRAIDIIANERMVSTEQPGERHCQCKDCNGTGYKLRPTKQMYYPDVYYHQAVKCDCHPEHAYIKGEIPAVDSDGTICWIDAQTGDYLYRAQDCPEGRQFLSAFAKLCGKPDPMV